MGPTTNILWIFKVEERGNSLRSINPPSKMMMIWALQLYPRGCWATILWKLHHLWKSSGEGTISDILFSWVYIWNFMWKDKYTRNHNFKKTKSSLLDPQCISYNFSNLKNIGSYQDDSIYYPQDQNKIQVLSQARWVVSTL